MKGSRVGRTLLDQQIVRGIEHTRQLGRGDGEQGPGVHQRDGLHRVVPPVGNAIATCTGFPSTIR